MDNADDYREKLTEARQNAAKCGRKGTEAALDAHWEVCCGDVLIAEENMQDQDREWENASLARDFLNIAYFLEGYDDRLDNLYIAIQRMRGTISNHPRLTIELLELEHTVIRRIEALCDHELDASEEVEAELAYYRQNVEYADKGRFDKIRDFENFLIAQGCKRENSNISESRYYIYNGVKYRFSGHIYPTGSMTNELLKVVDLAADPELIDNIKF